MSPRRPLETLVFNRHRRSLEAVAAKLLLLVYATVGHTATLTLQQDSTVVVLGNTFAERMQLYGYFETAMHCRFSDHHLRFRNLGWSADEVDLRIRPQGFPDLLDDLREFEADVLLLCFGMNESFAGPGKIDDFRRELGKLVGELQQHQFNGQFAPRVVLVSPIAHEPSDGNLPGEVQHNLELSSYVKVMAETADEREVVFLDLFNPTLQWMTGSTKMPRHTAPRVTRPGGSAAPSMRKTTNFSIGGIHQMPLTFTVGATIRKAPNT